MVDTRGRLTAAGGVARRRTMRCERARESTEQAGNRKQQREQRSSRTNGPVTLVGQRATGHSAPSQQWGCCTLWPCRLEIDDSWLLAWSRDWVFVNVNV